MPDAIFAGDDDRIEFTLEDADGEAFFLDHLEAIRWALAASPQADPVLEKSLGDGIEIIDAEAGRFDVVFEAGETSALARTWYHEVEIVDETGAVRTPFSSQRDADGPLSIRPTALAPE